MNLSEAILTHLSKNTFSLKNDSKEKIADEVAKHLTSGWSSDLLPSYKVFDGTESASLVKTLTDLSNLTKCYYFLVVADTPVELTQEELHECFVKETVSHMWMNAMRTIKEEDKVEIARWVDREARYLLETENRRFVLFYINRS